MRKLLLTALMAVGLIGCSDPLFTGYGTIIRADPHYDNGQVKAHVYAFDQECIAWVHVSLEDADGQTLVETSVYNYAGGAVRESVSGDVAFDCLPGTKTFVVKAADMYIYPGTPNDNRFPVRRYPIANLPQS